MIPEAKVEEGVPRSEGWFVVNAREARWLHNELGGYCPFEGHGAGSKVETSSPAEAYAGLSEPTAGPAPDLR